MSIKWTKVNALLAIALAGVLALGAMSVLADEGGTPQPNVPAVDVGDESPEPQDDEDGDDPSDEASAPEDNEDADDDADDDGESEAEEDNGEVGHGAQLIAQVIADEFEVSREDVLAFHDEGIGFGAIFKLHALAAAQGITVEELLATIPAGPDGEFEFAFGNLRKSLTEDQQAALDDGPKNLGALVSGSKKDAGADADDQTDQHGSGGGHGPPPHAQAHGRK